jgi:O-antigen ligase
VTVPAALRIKPSDSRIGFLLPLLVLWMLFEFGRPPTPPMVPLLITIVLGVEWIIKPDKQWSKYSIWYFVLLGVIAAGALMAANNFAAYFSFRFLATVFIGVCLPTTALLRSVKQVRFWILGFVLVCVYVGGWAATHSGFGPAASNGQDENYVATLMGLGVALAYFSIFAEGKLLNKLALAATIPVFVAAMALAQNASRGGFIALCAVALYGVWRSPKKMVGLTGIAVIGLSFFALAGKSFWNEIGSSADYESGTGDVRIEIWKAGLRMWQANPILGVGGGNFRWVIGDYQTEEQMQKFGRSLGGSIIAHSMHVELLSELGTAGVICTWVLIISTWVGLGKIRPPKRKPGAPPVSLELQQLGCYADALRAAMIAVLLNGVFLSLLYYSHIWVLIAAGTALPFIHRRIVAKEAALGTPGAPAASAPPRNLPHRMGWMAGHLAASTRGRRS